MKSLNLQVTTFCPSSLPYTWSRDLSPESSSPFFNIWWSYFSNNAKGGSMFGKWFDSPCTFMPVELPSFVTICAQWHSHLLLVWCHCILSCQCCLCLSYRGQGTDMFLVSIEVDWHWLQSCHVWIGIGCNPAMFGMACLQRPPSWDLEREFVRIFLWGYLYAVTQCLLTRRNFLHFNSLKGFWWSLTEILQYFHFVDNSNHLKDLVICILWTWQCPSLMLRQWSSQSF